MLRMRWIRAGNCTDPSLPSTAQLSFLSALSISFSSVIYSLDLPSLPSISPTRQPGVCICSARVLRLLGSTAPSQALGAGGRKRGEKGVLLSSQQPSAALGGVPGQRELLPPSRQGQQQEVLRAFSQSTCPRLLLGARLAPPEQPCECAGTSPGASLSPQLPQSSWGKRTGDIQMERGQGAAGRRAGPRGCLIRGGL